MFLNHFAKICFVSVQPLLFLGHLSSINVCPTSKASPVEVGWSTVPDGGMAEKALKAVPFSPFFHLLASHFMSCTFFSLLFLPLAPSLYAERRPPWMFAHAACRPVYRGNVCPVAVRDPSLFHLSSP